MCVCIGLPDDIPRCSGEMYRDIYEQISDEGHYGRLMLREDGGEYECRDAVGSMCHPATHRPQNNNNNNEHINEYNNNNNNNNNNNSNNSSNESVAVS